MNVTDHANGHWGRLGRVSMPRTWRADRRCPSCGHVKPRLVRVAGLLGPPVYLCPPCRDAREGAG